MFKSLSSRIVLIVVSVVLLTVTGIVYCVQQEIIKTLSHSRDENTQNLLNAALLSIANEYKELQFHKKKAIEMRKIERSHIVTIAIAAIDEIHKNYEQGIITEDQAKHQAVGIVKNMRYERGMRYLWINDMGMPIPKMIMHPTIPELDGTLLDDPKYNYLLTHKNPDTRKNLGTPKNIFQAFVDICLTEGEGYVEYVRPNTTKNSSTATQPKISYVALFKPWNWVVGTAVHTEDIEMESRKRLQTVISNLRETFSKVRLGKSGYVYVFDGKKQIIVHPALAGTDGSNLINPSTGNPILDDLITASKNPEQPYEYIWDKPPEHKGEYRFLKRASIRYFKPLDWYIATSFYTDELEMAFSNLMEKIFYISISFLAVSILLSILLSKTVTSPIRKIIFSAKGIESNGISSTDIPITGIKETEELGKILNKMLHSMSKSLNKKKKMPLGLDKPGQQEVPASDPKTDNREGSRAKEKAESSNQYKGEFLSNMSHEIRTHINSVLGFTEILKERIDDPVLSNYLESIQSSGQSLLTLINDLLDLSRIRTGRLKLKYTPVCIKELCTEMEIMFKQKTDKRGIDFITRIPAGLPKALFLDEARLRQIMVNLISNAVEYTEKGSITLWVGCEPSYEPSNDKYNSHLNLMISVRSTAIEMTQAGKEKLFNFFEQLKATETKKLDSTALGAAIIRGLIKIMHGEITVKIEPDQASSVSIHFRKVKTAKMDYLETRQTNHLDPVAVKFERSTVIVADDIEFNRDLIKTYLEDYDFDILEAENGKEVIEMVYDHDPDLILLDMKMPQMDGYEASAFLKKDENLRNIPIIAVTASAMKQDEENIRISCDAYLRKPVSRVELVSEIMKFLPNEALESESSKDEEPCVTETGVDFFYGIQRQFPQVFELLSEHQHRCRTLYSLMTIDKIETFGLEIKKLGKNHNCPPLVTWADVLYMSALQFDMDKIKKMLENFQTVFEKKH